MTLSLDDVRNKRFRMARKSGYEVLEVDEFVDEVEEAFGQLIEENQNLKKQVESLKSTGGSSEAAAPAPAAPVVKTPEAAPAANEPTRIVVTTGKEASTAVVRLVEMSTEQSERLVEEATEDANRIREEANRSAHQVTTDARTRAERVESEARVNAERLQAGALSRAEQLDRDIESRRSDMFGELEKQRDQLSTAVQDLRHFEATYRSNLTSHLRSQIDAVESGKAEPTDVPQVVRDLGQRDAQSKDSQPTDAQPKAAAPQSDSAPAERDDAPTIGGGSPSSDTPRLDALLGDQR